MPEINSSKFLVMAGWDDVPHLDAKTKAEMLANTPRHLRDARTKGIPSMGVGAIYPFEDDEIACDPFPIPPHFAKGYGMDVGWDVTAATFGAWDRDADVMYIYAEHYRGHAEPSIHADAIRTRGDWLIGACDYSGGDQSTGQRTIDLYRSLNLNVVPAIKAVEPGLLLVEQMLSAGRLKIFRTCQNWFAEKRLYRRDDKGRVVKKFDHLMDCTRYLVMDRANIMRTKPVRQNAAEAFTIADRHAGY